MIQHDHPSIITNIPSIEERVGNNIVVHERDEEYADDPLMMQDGGKSLSNTDLVNAQSPKKNKTKPF